VNSMGERNRPGPRCSTSTPLDEGRETGRLAAMEARQVDVGHRARLRQKSTVHLPSTVIERGDCTTAAKAPSCVADVLRR
jgi:hypothetical protein